MFSAFVVIILVCSVSLLPPLLRLDLFEGAFIGASEIDDTGFGLIPWLVFTALVVE